MKADRFLVTTSVNGCSRRVLWDSSNPISIDMPRSWMLENRDGAVWAVTGNGGAQPLDSQTIENEGTIHLEPQTQNDRDINVQLRRLKPIRAAYLPAVQPAFRKFEGKNANQLFAAFGVRKYLVNYLPIHEIFVGYVRKKPVFTFQRSGTKNTIKPLLDAVKIKFKGQMTRPVLRGDQLEISDEELSQVMIMRGNHWWRIMPIQTPEGLSISEMALKGFDSQESWFNRSLKIMAVIFALLCLLLVFVPTHPTVEEVKPAPIIPRVSLKLPTPTKAIKKFPVEERIMGGEKSALQPSKDNKPSMAEAKGPHPTVEVKEVSVPEPKKQRAAKPDQKNVNKPLAPPRMDPKVQEKLLEAKKLAAEKAAIDKAAAMEKATADKAAALEKATALKAAAADKAATAKALKEAQAKELALKRAAEAAAAAERAAAEKIAREQAVKAAAARAAAGKAALLKESLSGMMKGGSASPSIIRGSDSGTGAADVFDGKGTSLAPVAVKQGGYKKSGAVETLGGGSGQSNGGVSYGTGDHGKVRGQGNSTIDIGGGKSSVSQGLTKDEVGTVIHSHLAEVKYCYDSATLRRPGLEGKLVLQFTINGGGHVKAPAVESSTVDDPQLEKCVIGKLVSWKFPNPRGGIDVNVSYPFAFRMVGNE